MANDNEELNNLEANRASRRAANDAKRSGANRAVERAEREIARRAARDQKIADEPDDDYTPPPFSMSGIRNGLVHSAASKIVMILLIFIFAFGYFILGSNQPASNLPTRGASGNANAVDPVATAAGQPISRADFDRAVQQQAQMASFYGQTVNATSALAMQQSALQQLAGRAALQKAAQDSGLKASDDEVNAFIEKQITDKIAQDSGGNPANARRMIESQYGSEDKYRDQLRTQFDRDKVAQVVVADKYEKQWKEAHKPSEADYQKSLTQLNLSQIVIRPQAPLPTDKNISETLKKNAADAKARADKIAAQLKGLQGAALIAKFATLAQSSSDDAATKAKGGALGFKTPAELPISPADKDAISAISSTPSLVGPLADAMSGTHTIYLVAAKKLQLPKDYAKNKDKLFKAFVAQGQDAAWQKYAQDLTTTAELQIADPALEAFKAQSAPQLVTGADATANANGQDTLAKYEEALKTADSDQAAAIHFQMAQLYRTQKSNDKYIAQLRAAIDASPSSALPVRLELARALRENKDTKGAIEQLQAASKSLDDTPAAPSMFGGNPNDALRTQIASEFAINGRRDLAAAETKKIKPAPRSGNGNNMITIPGGGGNIQIPGNR